MVCASMRNSAAVAPYSGHMLEMVERSPIDRLSAPSPTNSTYAPTTFCARRNPVSASAISVAVMPGWRRPVSRTPTISGRRIHDARPSITFSASRPPTPTAITPSASTCGAGIEVLQVPYKGAGPAMNELLGGQVQLYFGNSISVMSQMTGGRVRALAVSSAQRLPVIGQVPTVAEQGFPGFDASTWLGLVGPAGLPAEVVARVNKEVVTLLGRKDVQEKLAFEGSIPTTGTPQQFAAFIKAEHTKWGNLTREANIRLE